MTPDSTIRARFGIRFSLLARRWRQALDAHLASVGLTDATWIPLIHLHETGGGVTQKELAALVGIDSSSLVRLLDILSREGLVERRTSTSDARARLVYLTSVGEERVAHIREELTRGEEDMLAGLSDSEITSMLDGFVRIEQRLVELQDKRAVRRLP